MFDVLDEFEFVKGAWHLVYYIPFNVGKDQLSYEIIRFKQNIPLSIKKWIKWTIDELPSVGIHFDYIVRALGSNEIKVSNIKTLDKLGADVARNLDSIYIPEVLAKKRATKKMHELHTASERFAEIYKVYFVDNKSHNLDDKNVLILDDVITCGTTAREIVRALNEEFDNINCYLYCLGKTLHEPNANDSVSQEYFV